MREYDPSKAAELHEHIHSHVPSELRPAGEGAREPARREGTFGPGGHGCVDRDLSRQGWPESRRTRRGAGVDDPDYKARLLADGAAGIKELGIEGHAVGHLKVVENTERVHNLVVCTLCSCYPHAVLGMSPAWYKKAAYRSRAVREPRSVLKEFGVDLPDDVAVEVWDSTAELRYLVLPQRPAGTEGWDDAALANIVTRDSMIGVERALRRDAAGVGHGRRARSRRAAESRADRCP